MTKSKLRCPISKSIDLNETWSRKDVTSRRIIKLLIENNKEFNEARENQGIKSVDLSMFSD